MTPDKAKLLLHKGLQLDKPGSIGTKDTDRAIEVVKKLGCLPLAVHQAAAFIRQKGFSLGRVRLSKGEYLVSKARAVNL